MAPIRPIPGGSDRRPTSAAFRKAARWLRNPLQTTEARQSANEETRERPGIGEDALRILRERYHVEES